MTTPRFGHPPIVMHRVDSYDDITVVGDFCWQVAKDGRRWIQVALPTVAPDNYLFNQLKVCEGMKGTATWNWDGDEILPTLMPSIHAIGCWHGWIRNGELVEA